MLRLMLVTQTPAISHSSSAERPACPRAITAGSVNHAPLRFQKNPSFQGISHLSATIHEHSCAVLQSAFRAISRQVEQEYLRTATPMRSKITPTFNADRSQKHAEAQAWK